MQHVTLTTNYGAIVIELNTEKAPKTCENFLQYVNSGFYNGTLFHRVIDGFMIQGGGFTENLEQKPVNGPIDNEADNGLKNEEGAIAMARTSDPHSATAQFFINVKNNSFLNFTSKTATGWGYCVFGKVIDGMDVVNKIKSVKTSSKLFHQDVPVDNVIITSATISTADDKLTEPEVVAESTSGEENMKRSIVPMTTRMIHAVSYLINLVNAQIEEPVPVLANVYLFNGLKAGEMTLSKSLAPRYFVMEEDDGNGVEVVGFVEITKTGLSTEIRGIGQLMVHPSRQKCGIGSELLKYALEKVWDDEGRICLVSTRIPEYFKRHGFDVLDVGRTDGVELLSHILIPPTD